MPVDKSDFLPKTNEKWRYNLQKELGNQYKVLVPIMPCSYNAKYKEWKIWFEKMLPFVKSGAIFVGHSLGGIFLAMYFAEKGDIKKTKGVFLIAAPFYTKSSKEHIADFVLPNNLNKLKKLGPKLHVYHSTDDVVVSFNDFKMYRKSLSLAQSKVFKNKGHFAQKSFPELVKDIKNL